MAKYDLRIKARKLRRRGISVRTIANYLGVSKGTASLWVRDIILTVEQLETLRKSELKGGELGRLKGALLQKQRRLERIIDSKKDGLEKLSLLTDREFLIAGIALYWGEGSKKQREVEFCNSDPKMVKFLLAWLQRCFDVTLTDIKCCVGINEMHRKREELVKRYWSDVTGIPLSQFTKTSFKKVHNKKVYENFHEHFGTLAVSVARSGRYFYKIIGLVDALSEAGSGLVSRGVS